MGTLTTITLHNDAQHVFEKYPEEFAKALFEGMHNAERSGKSEDIGFHGYCNYIQVNPPINADISHLYVHYGNTVTKVSAYSSEFKELCERCPDFVESLIEITKQQLERMKRTLKEVKETSYDT